MGRKKLTQPTGTAKEGSSAAAAEIAMRERRQELHAEMRAIRPMQVSAAAKAARRAANKAARKARKKNR